MRVAMRILTFGLMVTLAASVRADVFNMGGGQTSISLVPVGNPGNAERPGHGQPLRLRGLQLQHRQVRRDAGPVHAVPQRRGQDRHLRPLQQLHEHGLELYHAWHPARLAVRATIHYSVTGSNPQAANCPAFDVTWFDAARFCNWLQNGQADHDGRPSLRRPTETGAYTLNGDTTSGTETRNANAKYFIPSENEWYKAAYYNPSSGTYSTYATQSNIAPSNSLVLVPNDANYYNGGYTDSTNYLTPVGYFSTSPSYYGTFDQSGDVWNWNDAIISGSFRGLRGGVWVASTPASWRRPTATTATRRASTTIVGFRVASVPEPGSLTLLLACAVGFGIWRQRRNA